MRAAFGRFAALPGRPFAAEACDFTACGRGARRNRPMSQSNIASAPICRPSDHISIASCAPSLIGACRYSGGQDGSCARLIGDDLHSGVLADGSAPLRVCGGFLGHAPCEALAVLENARLPRLQVQIISRSATGKLSFAGPVGRGIGDRRGLSLFTRRRRNSLMSPVEHGPSRSLRRSTSVVARCP